MSRPSVDSLQWSVAACLVSVTTVLLTTALIVLPQWRAQSSARLGFVTLFVARDGSLRLWNRPINAVQVPGLLQRAERLSSETRIRVVLAPGVAWGEVQDLVSLLNETTLDVELQLPPTAAF